MFSLSLVASLLGRGTCRGLNSQCLLSKHPHAPSQCPPWWREFGVSVPPRSVLSFFSLGLTLLLCGDETKCQSKHFCGLVISTFLSRLSAEGAGCRGWAGGVLVRTILRHPGEEVTLDLHIQAGDSLVVAIGTPDPRGRHCYGPVLQWKVLSSCLHT